MRTGLINLNPHEYSKFVCSEHETYERFHKNWNGIITDNDTGFHWRTYGETKTLEQAELFRGMFSGDWNFPTEKEAQFLIHDGNDERDIDSIFGDKDLIWLKGKYNQVFSFKRRVSYSIAKSALSYSKYGVFLINHVS